MPVMYVNDIAVEITRKQVKNIRLTVSSLDGQVRLTAPPLISKEQLYTLVNEKYDWIKKHQVKVQKTPSLDNEPSMPEAALRNELKTIITSYLEKWEPIIGIPVAEWRIKRMRTRWGSCNPVAKRLWFSLALINTPREFIEYVVVHELVHFLEPSHNFRFKRYMDNFIPNWRVIKQLSIN